MRGGETELERYYQLTQYTLTHPDPAFTHQYVVDTFAAQTANAQTKPITLAFALVGLYLHVERNVSGRNIQRVHSLLARRRRWWPTFDLPDQRGVITVSEVLAEPSGPQRDAMIDDWSAAVWATYRAHREIIVGLIRDYLD